MIKKFHLNINTPKTRESSTKGVGNIIERSRQNHKVRAVSHFKVNSRKQHISMFETSGIDNSSIILSPEDNAKNKPDSDGNTNMESSKLLGFTK
jgi:hypothetical protein